ncbi:MAG: hypothetical protein K6A36_07290 [Paludibacteraceae bacterium]|nr:hypothetical protein [Paludibacteraceae bacterium]
MNKTLRNIKRAIKYLLTPKRYYKGIVVTGKGCDFLAQFITDRMQLNVKRGDVTVFSAYSILYGLYWNRAKYKFFFTAENTHAPTSHWLQFENIHLRIPSLTLSLGFDYCDHPRYMRFPYWLERPFGPFSTLESVSEFVHQHNYADIASRTKQCAFICRKDYYDDRALFADMVEQIMPISYPSDFRHNDDDMRGKYNDDKIAYLRQFRFNLCPENTNSRGYVTEKIFEAIAAGCVPIYWGNEGYPEPDILNPKAIVYLDKDNPTEGLELLRKLKEDPEAYAEFASQPRFLPNAEKTIYAYYERLEKKMKDIFKN